jgi:L-lactate dehydrogenase complex protein LldG
MSARDELLARVRAAIAPAAGASEPIPRDYRASTDEGIDVFLDRLRHYDANAKRVDAAELDVAVRATLTDRRVRQVVAPDGIPEAWVQEIEPLRDNPPLDAHALDRCDGVVTTCAVAIAQTGTIVLDGASGMGRRALTLVPDYHLCVVYAEQVVGSIPEALARLEATRPLTFVSGPSATVDIEMVRVSGVHGPRRLDVLVAG